MKSLIIFLMFFCPQLLSSQNFNSDNGVSKLLQECLEYGVFMRGNYDSPYISDIDGNILGYGLFDCILSPIKDYKDGFIIVCKYGNNSQGLYDLHTKRIIIPLQENSSIYKLREGKYIINTLSKKSYLYDTKSKTKIDTKYSRITRYHDSSSGLYLNFFVVNNGINIGVVNNNLELLIPCEYDDVEFVNCSGSTESDYRLVKATKKNGLSVFYDICTRQKIYSHLGDFCECIGRIKGKYCFLIDCKDGFNRVIVDENNHKMTTEKYMSIEPIGCNTFFAYQGRSKAGLLNDALQNMTPFIYDYNPYREQYNMGLFSLVQNGKYGMLNVKGNIVIPFIYDDLCFFDNGTIRAKKNSKLGVIDKKGNTIIPFVYDDIYEIDRINKFFLVKQNNKWGCIDRSGKITVPFVFDFLYDKHYCDNCDGLLTAENKDDKGNTVYSIWDVFGNEIIPLTSSEYEAKFLLFQHIYNQSDVDSDIPNISIRHPKTFALIIANENYIDSNTSKVNYAQRDGKVFKEYCQKTLGIPEENILYIQDGTLAQMYMGMSKLKDLADIYNDSKVIVYYAGHGVPDEQNTDSYLLPVDGMVNNNRTAISLSTFYDEIGKIPSKQTLVFLDACFSVSQRDGKLLSSKTRGVAIKAKAIAPKGNMIVFSASNGVEAALSYKKGKHGLFTYFLLKKLKESSGNVSLGELNTYLSQMVKKHSIIDENKKQSPTVSVAINNWETIKINENE